MHRVFVVNGSGQAREVWHAQVHEIDTDDRAERAQVNVSCADLCASRLLWNGSRFYSAPINSTEWCVDALDLWAYQRGVTLDFSRPGKPTDNAFIETFNGRFRAECLNVHWFLSREGKDGGLAQILQRRTAGWCDWQ
jgi:hypothetical protein